MTTERAVYFKTLLLCGYTYELNDYLDIALETSEKPDEIIIDLVFCKNEKAKTLSVLNNIIEAVSEKEIDYSVVYQHILGFLKEELEYGKLSLKEITDLMLSISDCFDIYDDLWQDLRGLAWSFENVTEGYISESEYLKELKCFLYDNKKYSEERALMNFEEYCYIQGEEYNKQKNKIKRYLVKILSKLKL